MPSDLAALQAAAANGKAGLQAYATQKAALDQSRQQAIQGLLGDAQHYGAGPAGATYAARLGETGDRGDALLNAGQHTAGMRQDYLGLAPANLQAVAAQRAKGYNWAADQARNDSTLSTTYQTGESDKARAGRKSLTDEARKWQAHVWDVQHGQELQL